MNKKILVYDDDKDILFVTRYILEQENYDVETNSICKDVVSEVLAAKPDLILMDLWMPALGGELATTLLKENELTRAIPVLLFSANDFTDKIMLETCANGYIKKPFDIRDLRKTIADAFLKE